MIAAGMAGAMVGAAVAGAEIVNRWSFNEASGDAPSGTAVVDSVSGATAHVRGNGSTFTGTGLSITGTTNGNQSAEAIAGYVDLPNGIFSSKTNLTIEIWASTSGYGANARLFEFGRVSGAGAGGGEEGEIVDTGSAPGSFFAFDLVAVDFFRNSLNTQSMSAAADGRSIIYLTSSLGTDLATTYHYVFTFEAGVGSYGPSGGRMTWYRDGAFVATGDVNFHPADIEDVNNWLGRSNSSSITLANAIYDEVRLYDRVLTAREINDQYAAGPDAPFSPPVAMPDTATIHAGQKVLVDVLANDTSFPDPAVLHSISPPGTGTATIRDGKILYAHSGGDTSPVTFTYRASNSIGISEESTVTIEIAQELRITNPSLSMPAAPPPVGWQLVDAYPGLTFTRPVCLASVPGDATRLYVCEQTGKIRCIDDVTSPAPTTHDFLDLASLGVGFNTGPLLAGQPENGLLGLAFHPDHATNGYFYVAYTIYNGSYRQRVARFTRSTTDPTIADPTSQLILLDIRDIGLNHNGGDLHFGPHDGYLYYGTGDGDNSSAGQAVSQKIDGDFYSGIFRIDVDKKPGSLPPNRHTSIPTDDGVARFNVPPDNPYVHTSLGGTWDGTYNTTRFTTSRLQAVRTEYWATGIRHCWRMSFDPLTGDLWEGDVGQNTYEEINKIVKGGNYGWSYREGAHTFKSTPSSFSSIDPFYEYVHTGIAGGDASLKGNSVCGGYVYRGTRHPSLVGSYIFCDSVSGHVWQMDTTTGATARLTGLPGAYGVFSAQGIDPSNQDLLFCAYLNGKIMRLSSYGEVTEGFPTTLSATGLFADLSDLSPAPGLLPYQPNLSFWSDHAAKRRWFTIPDAVSTMTWSKDGNWTLPAGTVWVKHFDIAASRGNPATNKRVETRVLVKTDTGTYGVSYRWNEEQTEATLVGEPGVEFDIAIDDHGTPHTQRWQIPGRTSCLTCHTPQGGHALSFNTRQLNMDFPIHGHAGNQIETLAAEGFLANTPDPVSTLARHIRPDETGYPLEQRARSYFAVNCAYCHQAGGSAGGAWDGRAHLTLEQTGLINGTAINNQDDPSYLYVVPGDPARSIALHRIAGTNGFARMPPLATNESDHANIQLVTDWILQNASRPLYDEWRSAWFTALDPLGDKAVDADNDGVTNYDEYLRGSSPVSGSGNWNATIGDGGLRFLRKANRYYSIETSDSLDLWDTWSIPELDRAYSTSDEWIQIPLPADSNGRQYFRFHVTEP